MNALFAGFKVVSSLACLFAPPLGSWTAPCDPPHDSINAVSGRAPVGASVADVGASVADVGASVVDQWRGDWERSGRKLAGPQQDSATESKLKKLLGRQVKAWNEGNIREFMSTYWKSEELTFSSEGQTIRGWQATLDRYEARYDTRQKMGQLSFDALEITQLGDSAALVLGRWHLQRSDDSLRGNFTLVLRKFENGWKIIHDHSSAEPRDDGGAARLDDEGTR